MLANALPNFIHPYDERSESRKGIGRWVRIIEMVMEGTCPVLNYDCTLFSPHATALIASRFAPRPILSERFRITDIARQYPQFTSLLLNNSDHRCDESWLVVEAILHLIVALTNKIERV